MRLWSPCWCWESTIPSFICDQIINSYKNQSNFIEGGISSNVAKSGIRKSDVVFINDQWVNSLLYGYICAANSMNFNYKLSSTDKEYTQFTRYEVGDYYRNHCDFDPNKDSLFHTRKLSATLQLCDPDEYGGGDLVIDMSVYENDANDNSEFNRMIRSKGSIVVFDSRIPHEVIPVTHGTRYSLVKWVHGDTPLI